MMKTAEKYFRIIGKFSPVLAFIILLTGCATIANQNDNTTKTSVTYKIVKSYAAGTGQKELFSLDTEALSAYLEAHKTNEAPPPKYITKRFVVTEELFSGSPDLIAVEYRFLQKHRSGRKYRRP
ncbi:hypothetical protein AGMMS49944_18960 [Spirochaetia bacterium]|nr:hypothetical protein AGMMS49944_18960 [Spirochaetia bacterium]